MRSYHAPHSLEFHFGWHPYITVYLIIDTFIHVMQIDLTYFLASYELHWFEVVLKGRCLTSAAILQQLRDREEADLDKEEAKERRKTEREQKQIEKRQAAQQKEEARYWDKSSVQTIEIKINMMFLQSS